MKRFVEAHLDKWYSSPRRKALVIRGARQVGKSTLVRNFAAYKGLDLLEFNLEQNPETFIWQSMRGDVICKEIELASEQKITKNTLLFIDEIQQCPTALQALRYLAEEAPDLPVIAAGSLLEFLLGEQDFSMPVGRVSYYHLGPMSFREFLIAGGKSILEESLHELNLASPSLAAHKRLTENYLEFLYTGGMPEAVAARFGDGSMLSAREVHRSIVSTYKDDFGKYRSRIDPETLELMFDKIPLHLGEKVKYVNYSRTIPSVTLKSAISALTKARIILPAFHTSCSGLPLRAVKKENVFKLYFLDVGLSNYVNGISWEELSKDETALTTKGSITEQFIAQHLAYKEGGLEPPELYFWLREGKSTNAEVDFITSEKNRMIIIEVKAGKSGCLRSMHQLIKKTGLPEAYRFDMNPESKQEVKTSIMTKQGKKKIEFNLCSYPAYSVETFLEGDRNEL